MKLLIAFTYIFIFFAASLKADPPVTVPSVDLNRYIGKWYEIARLPFSEEFFLHKRHGDNCDKSGAGNVISTLNFFVEAKKIEFEQQLVQIINENQGKEIETFKIAFNQVVKVKSYQEIELFDNGQISIYLHDLFGEEYATYFHLVDQGRALQKMMEGANILPIVTYLHSKSTPETYQEIREKSESAATMVLLNFPIVELDNGTVLEGESMGGAAYGAWRECSDSIPCTLPK